MYLIIHSSFKFKIERGGLITIFFRNIWNVLVAYPTCDSLGFSALFPCAETDAPLPPSRGSLDEMQVLRIGSTHFSSMNYLTGSSLYLLRQGLSLNLAHASLARLAA